MKNLFVYFLLFFFTATAKAQPTIEWQKLIGWNKNEVVTSFKKTTDGGYIVVGNGWSTDIPGAHGGIDILVVKLDSTGSIEWYRSLGGNSDDIQGRIQQTSDNGYILYGRTESTNGDVISHGQSDGWVVKLSETGEIQWQRAIGGSKGDILNSLSETADGGYIIAGGSDSKDGDFEANHGITDMFYMKLSNEGDIEWSKTLGGAKDDTGESIGQTSDGGYVVAGVSYSNDVYVSGNHGGGDMLVVKLSPTGTLEWKKVLGGSELEQLISVLPTADGGFILAGTTASNDGDISENQGSWDYWLVKLSNAGVLQWQKTYGGSSGEQMNSIEQLSDGGFLILGTTYSNDSIVPDNHGISDAWVLRLNSVGAIQWQKALGGSGSESYAVYKIKPTNDGGYIFSSHSESTDGNVFGNHGNSDCYLVKLNSLGEVLWDRTLGGTNFDEFCYVEPTTEGGYMVMASTNSQNGDVSGDPQEADFWFVKLSPDIVGTSEGQNLIQTDPLKIFPNPSRDKINLSLETEASFLDVSISDLLGRSLLQQSIEKDESLDISRLPNGLYLVFATTASGRVYSSKIIKQE